MMEIGKLIYKGEPGSFDALKGRIQTLDFDREVLIERIDPPPEDERKPTHSVHALSESGGKIQIGIAWQKTVCEGPNKGQELLSAKIDGPWVGERLDFAVFNRGDHAVASWKRRRTSPRSKAC